MKSQGFMGFFKIKGGQELDKIHFVLVSLTLMVYLLTKNRMCHFLKQANHLIKYINLYGIWWVVIERHPEIKVSLTSAGQPFYEI